MLVRFLITLCYRLEWHHMRWVMKMFIDEELRLKENLLQWVRKFCFSITDEKIPSKLKFTNSTEWQNFNENFSGYRSPHKDKFCWDSFCFSQDWRCSWESFISGNVIDWFASNLWENLALQLITQMRLPSTDEYDWWQIFWYRGHCIPSEL